MQEIADPASSLSALELLLIAWEGRQHTSPDIQGHAHGYTFLQEGLAALSGNSLHVPLSVSIRKVLATSLLAQSASYRMRSIMQEDEFQSWEEQRRKIVTHHCAHGRT